MRAFFVLITAITFISCQAQQSSDGTLDAFADVSNEQAQKIIESEPDLQIIDVRQNAEVAGGMIDGAQQMDISKPAFYEQIESLDKTKPVLVYCAAGGRSKTAQEIMQEAGFKTVYNLRRGYGSWK
ncbi:MAG: hypothetical protein Salg2KO_07630 [Salibacteraceae bacterium]